VIVCMFIAHALHSTSHMLISNQTSTLILRRRALYYMQKVAAPALSLYCLHKTSASSFWQPGACRTGCISGFILSARLLIPFCTRLAGERGMALLCSLMATGVRFRASWKEHV